MESPETNCRSLAAFCGKGNGLLKGVTTELCLDPPLELQHSSKLLILWRSASPYLLFNRYHNHLINGRRSSLLKMRQLSNFSSM